jgi:hypothetical protein
VSVNVQPSAFAPVTASQDPWVGLIARYVDDRNYYYVSLRDSNLLSLRKRVNGAVVGLGSVALDVAPGTNYTVRLDAIGDRLRVFVNGRMLIEHADSSLPAGTYGLATYKAGARFTAFQAEQP